MPDTKVFDQYSRYYNLLYRDKDYAAETGYLRDLLARHGIRSGDILEFGSGTGKHGRLLTEHGFNVHGIERSAEMVALANQTDGFTCEVGDILTARMGRTYDAVLSLFHVVSYQTTNEQVKAVLASAYEHLEPGGLFIFDIWYTPAVYAQGCTVRVKRMADSEVEITRVAEPEILPNENRVNVHYTVFSRQRADGVMHVLHETHGMRHFSIPEIDFAAEAAGFHRIAAEEFLTANAPGENTWGVCFVLKRG